MNLNHNQFDSGCWKRRNCIVNNYDITTQNINNRVLNKEKPKTAKTKKTKTIASVIGTILQMLLVVIAFVVYGIKNCFLGIYEAIHNTNKKTKSLITSTMASLAFLAIICAVMLNFFDLGYEIQTDSKSLGIVADKQVHELALQEVNNEIISMFGETVR